MKNYFMKKIAKLVAVAAFLGVASLVQANVTVIVNGEMERIPLTPGPGSWKAANSGWAMEKGKYHLTVNPGYVPGDGEWEENEFSFTPDADGQIFLIFSGIWRVDANKKPVRHWAGYRNIVIEGAEVADGSFAEPNAKRPKEVKWNFVSKDGEKYLVACSQCVVRRKLKVKKGQKVVVKLEATRMKEPAGYAQ